MVVRNHLRELLADLPGSETFFLADKVERDLVLAFLMTFARAEYALKAKGFARPISSGGISIGWDCFAEEIAPRLWESDDQAVSKAIDYLTRNPPMREVLGPERWEERKPNRHQDTRFLIRSVTTVRNNLFHGGKEMRWRLAERDRDLLESCLTVLKYCLALHEGVWRAFAEAGPSHAA